MKTKISLRLDSEILKEVRVLAAEKGISISEFLAAKLQDIVQERGGYAHSKKRALARLRKDVRLGWVRPASVTNSTNDEM
jgi:hypothetical protein